MDNFKTYYQDYQIHEGVIDKIKRAASAVGGAIDKGISAVGQSPGKAVDAVKSAAVGATGKIVAPDITDITTFEDLNKIIKGIITKAKVGEVADQAIGFAVDQVLGLIPFAGNIKSAFDLFKGASKQPDEQDTGSFIDKLDVDDDLSKIIDDPIEGRFLKHIQKVIEKKKGKIPPEWDINMELKQFLATNFGGRTVAGGDEADNPPKTDPHLKALKV